MNKIMMIRCFKALFVNVLFISGIVASHAANEEITACIGQKVGQTRVVTDASECRNNEFPVTWNTEGPRGEKGDIGPVGPPGKSSLIFNVMDADRVSLGQLLPWVGNSSVMWIWNNNLEVMVPLGREDGELLDACGQYIYFEFPNCQGTGWIPSICHRTLIGPVIDPDRFIMAADAPLINAFQYQSRTLRPYESCENVVGEINGREYPWDPAGYARLKEVTFDDLGYALPRNPPLYLELDSD